MIVLAGLKPRPPLLIGYFCAAVGCGSVPARRASDAAGFGTARRITFAVRRPVRASYNATDPS
jgi:hypothetical protein